MGGLAPLQGCKGRAVGACRERADKQGCPDGMGFARHCVRRTAGGWEGRGEAPVGAQHGGVRGEGEHQSH